MNVEAIAERVWYGDDLRAGMARAGLAPLASLFGGVTRVRSALYDRGLKRTHALALPAMSIGNLTVGGTGKTPVAAWMADRLLERGARPALVLRGFGGDEPRVHALLNPQVPVVASADRVAGALQARTLGADVVVLDDAFQHRRASRTVDLVLLAAERAHAPVRLLPAGPYREGLGALVRASAVLVTRKSACTDDADALVTAVATRFPELPTAVVHLAADALRSWSDFRAPAQPIGSLTGARVLAVSGIGDPRAFEAQLQQAGASVEAAAYPDHHAFTEADVARLIRRAEHVEWVVCTLKDAVKLGPLWPRQAPALWYVSQRVTVERGGSVLEGLLDRLLAARSRAAGPAA